jgi:hypothetical protein
MLRNYALQISGADSHVQLYAFALNPLGEQQSSTAFDQPSQAAFALNERQRAQVFAVVPEQIESIETHILASAHQRRELAATAGVEANQLTIENGIFDRQRAMAVLSAEKLL